MKSIYHHIAAGIIVGGVFTVAQLCFTHDIWNLPKCALIFVFFSAAADIDKAFNSHRNALFHSIIIPLLFVLCWNDMYPIFIAWGCHLLFDIAQERGKKPLGSYNIILWKGKRLSGKQTKYYLSINGWIGVLIGIIFMVI